MTSIFDRPTLFFFLKVPLLPIYTNFEWENTRGKENRLKTLLLTDFFFQKLARNANVLCQNRVFMFWERSENLFF